MNRYILFFSGKTHKFISTQWGFAGSVGTGENVAQASGVITLLYGPAGVGKTSVAHAIAYELGQPIKVYSIDLYVAGYEKTRFMAHDNFE